jgi:hypothetical protein
MHANNKYFHYLCWYTDSPKWGICLLISSIDICQRRHLSMASNLLPNLVAPRSTYDNNYCTFLNASA